jgi:hypothetical protein
MKLEEMMSLERAVAQLRKSERGQRALEALAHFYMLGGHGLDGTNQRAFISTLELGMFFRPYELTPLIERELEQVRKDYK